MITRDAIRELAAFESAEGCALSFYFQPWTPQNKSHREEAILVKDMVRNALREAEKNGKNGCARADLQKIMELAERLHGNHARAKAVFACSAKNFWREFDLPPRLAESRLAVNQRFHLKPLTPVLEILPRICITVLDRSKARLFEYTMDEVREPLDMVAELPRRGRSDGWGGYDAGHAERHVENEAMHHFKAVADRMREMTENNGCDKLVIGVRDETWPEIEPHLHPYVRQRLLGRFSADPATATAELVRTHADRLMAEHRMNRLQGLIREVTGEAHRNGRGALGMRRVLRSMETGEVQTLLLGHNFSAAGSQCRNCGHLDTRVGTACAVCGKETAEVEDVSDALLGAAIRNGIEVVYVPPDPDFEKAGNIAALLRFRADQNTSAKIAS